MNVRTKLKACLIVPIFFLVLACTAASARTIYVDDDGPADFNTIQVAIDAVEDGDRVLVATGIYDVNEPITYRGKNITLKSEIGPAQTIIRMQNPINSERASVFAFENGEMNNAILEGFTINGGEGIYCIDDQCGGGIFITASSPTIKDNVIAGNHAYLGIKQHFFCKFFFLLNQQIRLRSPFQQSYPNIFCRQSSPR